MLEGLSIVREAFPRTVRLVTTARLRDSVLRSLADNDQELHDIYEIEAVTSGRLVAQNRGGVGIASGEFVYGVPHANFINASFSYARPGELNRFNGPDRGAWYAALAVETCIEEVKFHMTEFLARTGEYHAVVEYAELFASLAGEYVSLRESPDHPSLNPDPSVGYPAGNALASATHARGLNGIIYPSVRHAGGICFAVLLPHAVQSIAQGDIYRMTWAGVETPTIEKLQSA